MIFSSKYAFRVLVPWFLLWGAQCLAWDYDTHHLINRLALTTLPASFPAFARTSEAEQRIAFLGGEADRWRNTQDLTLKHCNNPDHYFDIDELPPYRLEPKSLTRFRYEFVGQLARARTLHPENFPFAPTGNNQDRTDGLVGFLPWTIAESYARLKSAFSYLKAYEENGSPEEIANAQQNVIYFMGVIGHFLGDAAQPLHSTKHYNGWVGANPQGFTTNRTFHAWIDGGYPQKLGLSIPELAPQLRPAKSLVPGPGEPNHRRDIFPAAIQFLLEQFAKVEPLYQLDKENLLASRGPPSAAGRKFFEDQVVAAAQMLGDLWLAAWLHAPPDFYLQGRLARQKLANTSTNEPLVPQDK